MAKKHIYTEEQDRFIRKHYTDVSKCLKKFNKQFGTDLSYSALKSHANRKLKITTGFRPWTNEMNNAMKELLWYYPYKQATEIFNKKFDTKFTRKQVENHCVKTGISREYFKKLKHVDNIIKENIDKNYAEIRKKINKKMGTDYKSDSAICRRANNIGLNRPHRVWQSTDKRFINGKEVTFSEYVRFIGNRWHKLEKGLQPIAMQIVKLQKEIADKA